MTHTSTSSQDIGRRISSSSPATATTASSMRRATRRSNRRALFREYLCTRMTIRTSGPSDPTAASAPIVLANEADLVMVSDFLRCLSSVTPTLLALSLEIG